MSPPGWGASLKRNVGTFGRITIEGTPSPRYRIPTLRNIPSSLQESENRKNQTLSHVAFVTGYPAFDAPILQFAMEKAGMDVDVFEKQWLTVEEFSKYDTVVFLGSTTRAKMEPSGFQNSDHAKVKKYLQDGGTMIIGRELMRQLFPEDEGRRFVESLGSS